MVKNKNKNKQENKITKRNITKTEIVWLLW